MSVDLFISYRRADAGGHAGRLYDRLRHWFDDDVLFYDLEGIDIGETFPDTIEAAVVGASVVLVVIGPDWLEEINRRAARPEVDFVRREVELALARSKEEDAPLIVPVLMGGAVMPSAMQFHEALQPALTPLCTLDAHAFQGKQTDWDQQFVRLRDRLAQVPGFPKPRFRAPMGAEQPFHLIDQTLSPHFQDPNGLLPYLRQSLVGSGGAANLARVALFGMGGVGKTQLALKYSLEYRDAYAGVWWFRAESEIMLQLDAQEACRVVGAPSQPGENPSAALNRWLERQDCTWLLVYDNAEETAALRPHLPQGNRHHLMITSRNPVWGGIAQPLELDFWTPEQSADFLAARLSGAGRDDLIALAKDLGGLPLALEQAASYIEETACTVADYRNLLTGIDTEGLLLDEGRAATGYERTVAATLTLAFEKLSLPAQQLLRLCAYAAPEPLPECFFLQTVADLPPQLAMAVSQPLAWNKIVGELRRYGLAKRYEVPALDRAESDLPRTEQALSLHRLTQQTTRARHTQPAEDCRAFVRLLATCCPADPELPGSWPRYATLTPHVTQLGRYFDTGWCEHRPYSWLLNQVGQYLRSGPALYAESVSLLRRALAIDQAELGEEHPNTLTSMDNLASTLWHQGDLSGARALQEKVVEVQRQVQGEEHPDTLTSINNLALTLRDQGDLSRARTLQEKVVEVQRRVQGEEHPNTLTSMDNLASTLRDQGDLSGARALEEKVLEVRRRVLGEEHPGTLASMNNLAETLRDQGDLVGARTLEEKVLEVSRRFLGEEHPYTLGSMNNLASKLRGQGDLVGARTLLEKVLEVQRRVLGEEHPNTLTSMDNLASTLRDQGDLSGARALEEKVVEVQRRVLGEEHPNTLTSMANLASTLWGQGDLSGARSLEEKVVEVRRRVLGEEHPNTLTSMDNLASTLRDQGDLSGARALEEKVVEVQRRVQGEEHPDTLTSINNLALTLMDQGDLSGARALEEKVVEVQRRVQGEEHPNTLTSMDNLASTLRGQGDLSGARSLEEKVLEVRRRVLGEEHPDTLTSMANLASTLWDQGDLSGARALEGKVLEVRRRVLGDEHQNTSNSAWNLFCTLDQMGEHNTARELLRSHLVWLLERDPNELGAIQQQIRERVMKEVPAPESDTSKIHDPN